MQSLTNGRPFETNLVRPKQRRPERNFWTPKSCCWKRTIFTPIPKRLRTLANVTSAKKNSWANYVLSLSGKESADVIAQEVNELNQDIGGMIARAESRQWKVLDALLGGINKRYFQADGLRKNAISYKSDLTAKEDLVSKLREHVKTHKRPDSITKEIESFDTAITKAKELADVAKREYHAAMQEMAGLVKQCPEAQGIADACETYETKLVTANEKFGEIKDLQGVDNEINIYSEKIKQAAALATNEKQEVPGSRNVTGSSHRWCGRCQKPRRFLRTIRQGMPIRSRRDFDQRRHCCTENSGSESSRPVAECERVTGSRYIGK